MNIDAINALCLEDCKQIQLSPAIKQEATVSDFSALLVDKLITTNHQLIKADQSLTQLATGQTENLHQTMLNLEQAKLSFQYIEQIRNRLMTAYQELLREQI
ncbi:MAG: flagellar hook-basal body complex protein FliE [Legionella sp.]|jgi:flagellar hook-basal body complex protein FliE